MTDSYLDGSLGGCVVALLILAGLVVGLVFEGLVLMLAWNLIIVGVFHLLSTTISLGVGMVLALALHIIGAIF